MKLTSVGSIGNLQAAQWGAWTLKPRRSFSESSQRLKHEVNKGVSFLLFSLSGRVSPFALEKDYCCYIKHPPVVVADTVDPAV